MRLVLTNSFWIVGLALFLAAFSYHVDQASRHHRSLRHQLQAPSFVGMAWISLILVGIGLVATSDQIWEGAIWAAVTLLSIIQAIHFWKVQQANTKRDSND